jgi:hypothetical protein
MIMGILGVIRTISVHDHEMPGPGPPGLAAAVSDREINASPAERVWQTVTVTSGRIIIGWRVGT